MKTPAGFLSALVLFSLGSPAAMAAPVTFAADAEATLTVTGITPDIDLLSATLTGSVSEAPLLLDLLGNASVVPTRDTFVIGDPADIGVGDGYFNQTAVSGMADGPGDASAYVFNLVDGSVLIGNPLASVPITVDFLLSYTLSASTTFGDPLLQEAFAFADVQLNWESISGVPEFFVDTAASDTRFGDPMSVTDTFAFSMTILPGDAGTAYLQTASFAEATVVPVPAAAWLFVSGLGLLGWMRKSNA